MVPRFVKGILDRFDTMVERSAEELAAMGSCDIKPYWDPKLRSSKRELKRLVIGLAQQGLVSFRTGIKESFWIFCVKKKTPEWNRLIIDARRVNWAHKPPPSTRLATPRSFIDVQFKQPADGGPLAYGLEADVADGFYNYLNPKLASWFGLDCPLTAKEWKDLGWRGGKIFSDEPQCYFTPDDLQILHPVFEGVCMGWSWALFLANEAVAFAVAGREDKPLHEIRDRLPAPELGTRALTGVYVDNISIIGTDPSSVNEARQRIERQFEQDGTPLTWSSHTPQAVLETVGVILDFEQGVARNKPRRLWKAFLAGQEILRRRRVSIKVLEVWLGHMTSIFMLAPAFLSCYFHIFRFMQQNRGGRAEVWREVRREIRLSLGGHSCSFGLYPFW